MNDLYFATVEEASFQLRLPLLLTAPSAVAVPHLGSRLSEYAPRTVLGARLFHRLSLPPTYEPPAIWIVAPEETVEHLGWAVGLAEHVARAGRMAVLLDLDRGQPLRGVVGGNGQPLPLPVRNRLARVGVPEAAAWTSDLQGVRIVLPVAQAPDAPEMELSANWLLVVARTLPETIQEISLLAGNVDGVVLAAGIRDHSRQELEEMVRALRNAGASILGMVAMGPAAERQALEMAAPASPASPATAGPAEDAGPPPAAAPTPLPPPVWPRAVPPPPVAVPPEPPTPVAPPPVEPRESAVALAAEWDRRSRNARWKRVFITTLFLLAGLALGGWVLMRMGVLPPLPAPPDGGQGSASGPPMGARPQTGAVQDSESVSPEEDGWLGGDAADSLAYEVAVDSMGFGATVPDLRGEAADTLGVEHALSPDDAARRAPPVEEIARRDTSASPPPPREPKPIPVLPPTAAPVTVDTVGVEEGEPPAVAARTGPFVVHVSSFRRESDALQEVERLKGAGIEGRIVPVILEGRGRWMRIVVGSFPDSLTALAEATRLRGAGLVSFSQVLGRGGQGAAAATPPVR